MAANQTIIKAAGQRYTSVPIDYSGYIKGLQSVTNAIIAKTKETQKDQASIDKLMVDFNSKIQPYELLIKEKIGNADSPEQAMAMSKHFNEQKLRYETYMTKIHDMLSDGKQLTNSIDPQIELWLRSFGAGDFNREYSVTIPAVGEEGDDDYVPEKIQTFNMDFRLDENLNVEVIGPDGNYMSMDQLENALNFAGSGDGAAITTLITKFGTLPDVKLKHSDQSAAPTENFLAQKKHYLSQIRNLLKNGDGDISGNNVTEAFMFNEVIDITVGEQTEQTSFLKYYLSDTGGRLFPTEFKEQYERYAEALNNNEISEKLLAVIAQDLIKNDPNIKEDLEVYINYLLENERKE
tara:strand:+ start:1411 stop:2460 length:1050 start_codon:yes stop_codon:yes gene_type:complete